MLYYFDDCPFTQTHAFRCCSSTQDPVEGQSQLSPKPNQHQLYLDGEGTPTELRRPFDLSLDSPTGSGSASTLSIGLEGETASGPQRKKSATLLEIERNRSLFIEQQGKCNDGLQPLHCVGAAFTWNRAHHLLFTQYYIRLWNRAFSKHPVFITRTMKTEHLPYPSFTELQIYSS